MNLCRSSIRTGRAQVTDNAHTAYNETDRVVVHVCLRVLRVEWGDVGVDRRYVACSQSSSSAQLPVG